jgi:putative endonuclease
LPRPGSGQRAERRALRHYRLRGYRILAANVWIAGYELDLIARRGRRLVFCEVKSKSGTGFGTPEEMVDREKQRRLYRAADAWLARHPDCRALDASFEVIAVHGSSLRRVPLGDPL